MGVRLSIVVPIYNVEQYLPKCVESLLRQDLNVHEYEIILVDDGSTDASGCIADELSLNSSNIIVIHQANLGLGGARNVGISNASGEYIQFVDSDDYLEDNVLCSLINKMEDEQLDVLRFDYQNVNEQYEVFWPNKDYKPFVDYRDEVCDGLTFLSDRLGYACYACQFIIKRKLIIDNHLLFKEGVYFEDTEWTPRMLSFAERVTSVGTICYNYLMHSGSITSASDNEKKKKSLNDKFLLLDYFSSLSASVLDNRWYNGMIAMTALSVLSVVALDFWPERRSLIGRLRSIGVFPLSTFHITNRVKRKIRIANISPALYCTFIRIKSLV